MCSQDWPSVTLAFPLRRPLLGLLWIKEWDTHHIRIRREVPSCRSAWRPVPVKQVAKANSLCRMQSKGRIKNNSTRGIAAGPRRTFVVSLQSYKGKAKRGRVWRGEEDKRETRSREWNVQQWFQVQIPAGKAKDLSRASGAWWRKWREWVCKYAVWRNWCASHPSKGWFRSQRMAINIRLRWLVW